MKKVALSVAALALAASGALAADLPSRKGPPVLPPPPPPPPMWTGFYAGLNAGYNFGTNSNVQSLSVGGDATGLAGFVVSPRPVTMTELSTSALSSAGLIQRIGNAAGFAGNTVLIPGFVGFPSGAGLAQSGSFANTQSGFIGGGQIGYNYQWGSNFVIGIEADIQGTGIRGTSHGAGVGGGSVTSALFSCNLPTTTNTIGDAAAISPQQQCLRTVANLGNPVLINNANSIGVTTVNAGVDWMGTVRGRLGYLFTPTMLLYATGGLTYGGVYANVNQWANTSLDISAVLGSPINRTFGPFGTSSTFIGGGNKSQTLVGWNVGGGIEWMFMPNWSIKAEGIYWNMGNMTVPTAAFAAAPINGFNTPLSATNSLSTIGVTRVNYQGVIARMGINYHFNWGAATPVVARY